MNDESSFLSEEEIQSVKAQGKIKRRRGLLIAGYILFAIVFFGFFVMIRLVPIIALLPLFLWMLVYFTWPLVSFEYVITVEQATLRIEKKIRAKKKLLFQLPVKDITRIQTYTCSSPNAGMADFRYALREDAWALSYRNGDVTAVALLQMNEITKKRLKYYNKDLF